MNQPLTLYPSSFHGTVRAIPAKAEAHRFLIAAALSEGHTRLLGLPAEYLSQDILATVRVLRSAGSAIASGEQDLRVTPLTTPEDHCLMDCGESGSTLRFILPVMAARLKPGMTARFTGQGRLPQRPLTDLLEAMARHGATTSSPTLPFTLAGTLEPGTYSLPGNVSSQYITGLMLALPGLPGDSTIRLTTPLESASYVRITQGVLGKFGIRISDMPDGWRIPGRQTYVSPGDVTVGGDWSNAALWLVAGAISGTVTLEGLDMDSPQGDKAIIALLEEAGAAVTIHGSAVTVSPGRLHPLTVDVRDIPDLLPVLAILAAATEGTTTFVNAARLRLKESDRLEAVADLINSLGGQARTFPDALRITGTGRLRGGAARMCNDHRLVMAAVLASAIAQAPVTLDQPDAINKSYPALWQDMETIKEH